MKEITNSPECTLSVLKQARRFITTASFDTDTIGLKKALDRGKIGTFFVLLFFSVNTYKPLMKDFPLNELLTAAEIEKLSPSLTHIFAHLKRTSKGSAYPIQRQWFSFFLLISRRYLRLIEAISRDLCNKVLSLLQRKRLLYLDFDDFDKLAAECRKVFTAWEKEINGFSSGQQLLQRQRFQFPTGKQQI